MELHGGRRKALMLLVTRAFVAAMEGLLPLRAVLSGVDG
jgi:hypothetical protein